jgi:hypothetical protein
MLLQFLDEAPDSAQTPKYGRNPHFPLAHAEGYRARAAVSRDG